MFLEKCQHTGRPGWHWNGRQQQARPVGDDVLKSSGFGVLVAATRQAVGGNSGLRCSTAGPLPRGPPINVVHDIYCFVYV